MATEAPAAPSGSTVREVRIVEAPPPKPVPAPTRELRPSDIASAPDPSRPEAEPEKKVSSKESFTKRLEAKAKPAGEPTTIPTPIKEDSQEGTEGTEKPERAEGKEKPATAEGAKGPDIDPKTGKPKKANPWKLFEEEKKARATAEQEIQRLKSSIVPEQERAALMGRVEKAEKRAQELEDHIRFVNYEKSTEFKTKYQEPYEAAWKRATTDLAEISVTDSITGQPRAVTSQDILELVNMPLGKAREVADEMFGKFADDVMAHRKEIRGLFDKQSAALEEARKNGGLRDQQMREAFQKRQSETQKFVQENWKAAEQEFLSDKENGQYFKPKMIEEGKEPTPEEKEWNEALERGFKLVDEAWSSNALDPKLTPEQRKEVIKRNVAVRNRAAAFGPLKRHAKRLEARIKQLEKDLKEYSGSTPGAGGSAPEARVNKGTDAKSAFHQRLVKIAR
jgi:hypothetical protein